MDIYDANLSTVNKMQREYWTAKQVLKKKFGKEEDRHVIAGDTDIDSKLSQYDSIQSTCDCLIIELEKYHSCICVLARDESQLGRFLKEQGTSDRTQAGKMMIAVGKALCYSAQQRLVLRHSLSRLREDIETFRHRAIADTELSVKKMEDERTHYRASLLWMQDISTKLDPEQYKKLEKYRKVQNEVRVNKEKFDRLKWAVCQKVDLLCASRSNLFSNTLVPYQNEILVYWDNTARNMIEVLNSFEGYQHYEFKLLKQLNPMQLTHVPTEDDISAENIVQSENNVIDDDMLINFDESESEDAIEAGEAKLFDDAMDALKIDEGKDANEDEPTTADLLGNFQSTERSNEEMDLWNDLMGGSEHQAPGEFANQWTSAFGEFKSVSPQQQEVIDEAKIEKDMLDLLKPAEREQTSQKQNDNFKGFMPSQLMDMHFGQYTGAQAPQNPMMQMMANTQPILGQQPSFYQQQMPVMYGQQNNFIPNQPFLQNSIMTNASQMGRQQIPPTGPVANPRLSNKIANGDSHKGNKAAWYDLFAELDPLQNPDALRRKESEKESEDGRAC